MSDTPPPNPMLAAWLNAQSQMLKAQEPFWSQVSEAMSSVSGAQSLSGVEAMWDQARLQGEALLSRLGMASGEGIAQETLQKMLDPGQFLYAGSDEVNQAIQKLVEGPEFADIGMLERQTLKATREWMALREASGEYRLVNLKAWRRAFEHFSQEVGEDPGRLQKGSRALTDRWLAIANEELIATQRTPEFLAAQRKLMRAGVDYRLRERALVEIWCETHSIPTRTEIDDLQRTVHAMRRELRALRKEVATLSAPKAAARAPRRAKTEG